MFVLYKNALLSSTTYGMSPEKLASASASSSRELLSLRGSSSLPSCHDEQWRQRSAFEQSAEVHYTLDRTTYRCTDILSAVWTPDSRLDDLVVKDHHIQMSDRVQSQTDTQEVEDGLEKQSAAQVRVKTGLWNNFRR